LFTRSAGREASTYIKGEGEATNLTGACVTIPGPSTIETVKKTDGNSRAYVHMGPLDGSQRRQRLDVRKLKADKRLLGPEFFN
jgi:hypothetical protein